MTVTEGFGSAESSFRTNKPLMVRPQLPRFLRAGGNVFGKSNVPTLLADWQAARSLVWMVGLVACLTIFVLGA